MTWQELANSLPTGQKRKFQHCGKDASASVWKSTTGIGFKCYRCDEHDYEAFGVRSVADVIEARDAVNRIDIRTTRIPDGSTRLDDAEVPAEAHVWVLKAGMTPTEASTVYGFRWHAPTRRVFIPVNPKAVLARAVFPGERPKYKLFGELATTAYTVQGKDPLVIVEDVLSAIKVGKAGYKAAAILGTSVSPTILAPLAMRQRDIVIWLDPDKAGMAGRGHIKKALSLYPAKVRYARTTDARDPKYISREDIKSVIEETMKHDS